MYFRYNGKHYKQLQGTALGSPVSVVVAEIVMQNIEEQALATYTRTILLWLGYVDDTFTALHKDEIDDFHEHLYRQKADIQFSKESEEKCKIPFLDCLVTRDNNNLQKTDTYRPITRPVIVQPGNLSTDNLINDKRLFNGYNRRIETNQWHYESS